MPLFPTEAPAPTGKTLSEIRPAIPINASTAPSGGMNLHIIEGDGEYYLTRDIIVPSGFVGIRINAPLTPARVVLDLNGFTIRGEVGAEMGIWNHLKSRGVSIVRNGNITGCGVGLHYASWPAQISMNAVSIAEDLTITDCSSHGIEQLGTFVIIRNCILDDNGGSGLNGRQARVDNTRACGNGGSGFVLIGQAIIRDCIANRNGSDGFRLAQVQSSNRKISDCHASDNGRHGIFTLNDSLIERCVVQGNGTNGIESAGGSRIAGNLCRGHENGTGIVASSGCSMEDNYCVGNQTGVRLSGPGNLMRRNVCSGNTTNWDVADGNTGRVTVAVKSLGSNIEPDGRPLGSADPRVNYTL